MKNLVIIPFFIILLMSSKLFAGGWSSGGGELLKDSVNPWFLNNVSDIKYCIIIDETNFGTSKEVASTQIKEALQYWKVQSKNAILSKLPNFGQLQIASQSFSETNCNNNPDIKFQFGVLTNKQKDYLKYPSQFGAVSVRTEYDEVNLRGKGFIYVSPSFGPLAYNNKGMLKNAWAVDNGNLLFLTLVHELGHIYGLRHMGSYGELMSEGFVESLFSKNLNSKLKTSLDFFALPTGGELNCPADLILKKWQKLFATDQSAKCFILSFKHDSQNNLFGKTILSVYTTNGISDSKTKIQEIILATNYYFPTFTSLIWLPSNQRLFTQNDLKDLGSTHLLGISFFSIGKIGEIIQAEGKPKRSISIRFEQGKRFFFIEGIESI